MKTLYMMKGLPASGKSTRAKEMLLEFGTGNAKRVNKDDLRSMLDNGQWSKENEKFLLSVRDDIVISALTAGLHVIVDDTNLAPKHEAKLRTIASACSVAFQILDFTAVSVDECIARDRKRQNYVGEKVIRDMWDLFLRPTQLPVKHDANLPDCIIVDIDGTLAKMNGRSPFDWKRVGEDLPRFHVAEAVRGVLNSLSHSAKIIFLSGRDAVCRAETQAWLDAEISLGDWPLYMRPAGDHRKDTVVKRELYETYIQGRYNVCAIFDDRPQVIRLWRELGFADRVFDVGDGREF